MRSMVIVASFPDETMRRRPTIDPRSTPAMPPGLAQPPRKPAVGTRTAIAFALALVGAVTPFKAGATTAPGERTLALRFYDDNPLAQGTSLSPAAQRELETVIGSALLSRGRDSDGAFLFVPTAPLPDRELRSALHRLRATGAVIYAEAQTPTAKRDSAIDATPASALVVRMTRAADRVARNDLRARVSAKLGGSVGATHTLGGGVERIVLPRALDPRDAAALVAQVALHPDVLHVEVERRAHPQTSPADPMFASQWNLNDALGGINAPGGWQRTVGDATAPIAVLDTGMLSHPDLAGRVTPGYDMVAQSGFAGDGDGRDADPSDPGDFVTTSEAEDPQSPVYGCAPTASTWHGTMVAGIVGAAANNGLGVAAVNWNSPILNVRVMGKCGGALADIADGIRWAAGLPVPGTPTNPTPARVINLSLSGVGECGAILQSAVTEALAAGSVIVAAAGNDNADAGGRWPANCNGVIGVAGSSKDGSRSFFSNFGDRVALSAPAGGVGGSIPILRNAGADRPAADGHGYGQQVGTSLAAPHVAGTVSLVQALAPQLTPAEVRALLESTARPLRSADCATLGCGAGIVDVAAAVERITAGTAPVPVPGTPSPAPPPSPPPVEQPPALPPPGPAPVGPGAGAEAPPPHAVPMPGGWTAKDPGTLERLRKGARAGDGRATPAPKALSRTR